MCLYALKYYYGMKKFVKKFEKMCRCILSYDCFFTVITNLLSLNMIFYAIYQQIVGDPGHYGREQTLEATAQFPPQDVA